VNEEAAELVEIKAVTGDVVFIYCSEYDAYPRAAKEIPPSGIKTGRQQVLVEEAIIGRGRKQPI
jgi:hypothetical protein